MHLNTVSHLNKVVVDSRSIGQEEAAAGRETVEEEELLLSAQEAVIPLLGLLHAVLVVLHALLVWKGDSIHTLHNIQRHVLGTAPFLQALIRYGRPGSWQHQKPSVTG